MTQLVAPDPQGEPPRGDQRYDASMKEADSARKGRATPVLAIGLSTPSLTISWLSFLAGMRLHHSHDALAPTAFVVWGFFLMFAVAAPLAVLAEQALDRREKSDCAYDCDELDEALDELPDSTLRRLARYNSKQIRKFTVIAQRQARTSYYASLLAAAVSLAVLLAGAATAVELPDTTGKVWATLLTATGASLSGFLTRTFAKTYEMASNQMSYYYGQPLVHCYLLHAERVVSVASEEYGKDRVFPLLHKVVATTLEAGMNAQRQLTTLQVSHGGRRRSAEARSHQPAALVDLGLTGGDPKDDQVASSLHRANGAA